MDIADYKLIEQALRAARAELESAEAVIGINNGYLGRRVSETILSVEDALMTAIRETQKLEAKDHVIK